MTQDKDQFEDTTSSILNEHSGSETILSTPPVGDDVIRHCSASSTGLVHPAVREILDLKWRLQHDHDVDNEKFGGGGGIYLDATHSDDQASASRWSDSDVGDELVAGQPNQRAYGEPVHILEKGGIIYPGCDIVYPASSAGHTGLSEHGIGEAIGVTTGPIHAPEMDGVLYPGCDVVYPAPIHRIAGPPKHAIEDATTGVVRVPEKNGIMYPGCDVVYPATSPSQIEVSPEYTTYDPTARINIPPQSTQYIPPFPPPPTRPAAASLLSLTTLLTTTSLDNEKPSFITATTSASSLDADGFTPSEHAEHIRSLRYLFYLRLLVYYRLSIRLITTLVSLVVFALTLLAILLFIHIAAEPTAPSTSRTVNIDPHKAFASISGILALLSLALNVGCCLTPRLRKITPLSNFVFASLSLAGIFGWLSGCLYLHRTNGSGRNLWYYACSATSAAYANKRDVGGASVELLKICNFTQNAWDLGILQVCLEILTFINAVIAIVMVRIGLVRSGRRRNCFV